MAARSAYLERVELSLHHLHPLLLELCPRRSLVDRHVKVEYVQERQIRRPPAVHLLHDSQRAHVRDVRHMRVVECRNVREHSIAQSSQF